MAGEAVPTTQAGSLPPALLANENLLALAHVYTATAALTLGALFGLLQGFSRANFIVMPPTFDYYRMLTAHGVLMALVFTTFFIAGLLTFATYRSIPRVRSLKLGWIGYAVMLVGTVIAAVRNPGGQRHACSTRSTRR